MTEQGKQLLLIDLCARLPYGVKAWYKYGAWFSEKFATSIRLADEKIALSSKFNKEGDWFPIEEAGKILIKPYLRPMSSMTEEEKVQLSQYACIGEDLNGEFIDEVQRKDCAPYIDWLNKHHFDYHGLIEKGLALEAPKGMYN
jgi:hypothetical protein